MEWLDTDSLDGGKLHKSAVEGVESIAAVEHEFDYGCEIVH